MPVFPKADPAGPWRGSGSFRRDWFFSMQRNGVHGGHGRTVAGRTRAREVTFRHPVRQMREMLARTNNLLTQPVTVTVDVETEGVRKRNTHTNTNQTTDYRKQATGIASKGKTEERTHKKRGTHCPYMCICFLRCVVRVYVTPTPDFPLWWSGFCFL